MRKSCLSPSVEVHWRDWRKETRWVSGRCVTLLAVFVQGLSALLCVKSCSFVFAGCACRAVLCYAREGKGNERKPNGRSTERASIEGHSTWTVSTLWTFWAVLLSLEPLLEMLLLSLVYPLCEQASERMNEGRKQTSRVVKVSNLFPDSFAVWIQPLSTFSAVFRAPPLGSVRVFCHVTMA